MATFSPTPDLQMYYCEDDFTDPWDTRETVLLMHGNAESTDAWYAWIPHLARNFRVVRADMRGFGKSTPMPRDYAWSVERIMADFRALVDHLKIDKLHLVGAKVGGTLAFKFAALNPALVTTLTTVGAPVSGNASLGERIPSWLAHIEKNGVESWARWTMPGRMGKGFPAHGSEYWAKLMGKTPITTQLGFIAAVPSVDVTSDLPALKCPTLVITAEDSNLGDIKTVETWRALIPDSQLLLLPGNSYHPAASDPDTCAIAARDFMLAHPAQV